MKKYTNIRRKICLLIHLIMAAGAYTHAQDIHLEQGDSYNKQTVSVKLYDSGDGHFLLDLPLTFHITQENILFMIVGNGEELNGHAVWLFNQPVGLKEFLKRDKNTDASQTFKKQHANLEPFFEPTADLELYTSFDNGYERIQAVPRPVFFRVKKESAALELRIRCYVSMEKNDRSQRLSAEAGVIKLNIHITK